MSKDGLTGKQALFVRWYTTPGDTLYNGTKSAQKAGYKGPDSTWASIAHENLRKPKIKAEIRKAQKELFSAADITADRILNDIEMTRALALRDGEYNVALKASELHGKYLKMFIDRVENVHTLESVDNDELLGLLSELTGKIDGLDNIIPTGGDATETGGTVDTEGTPTTH
jgi:phage terminase small subunit